MSGTVPHTVLDLVRVLRALPAVEYLRRTRGPREAAEGVRKRGRERSELTPERQQLLRRVIRAVDRLCVANCYRRALLEMALDPAAAAQPLMMGFRRTSAPGSGHAWFASEPQQGDYDLIVSV